MIRGPISSTLVVAGLCACAGLAADGQVTKQQSELFKQKVTTIVQTGSRPTSRLPQRTAITENEVNAYLRYDAALLFHDDTRDGQNTATFGISAHF